MTKFYGQYSLGSVLYLTDRLCVIFYTNNPTYQQQLTTTFWLEVQSNIADYILSVERLMCAASIQLIDITSWKPVIQLGSVSGW